jgi:guanylate kinase
MSSDASEWAGFPGRVIVISGPSGSGKSTLVGRLLARADLRLAVSVSATTRLPRPGEVADHDYVFMSPEEFQSQKGGMLETADVHGHSYGTPAASVRRWIAEGRCVLLVIDVQGGFQVRCKVPGTILIFIEPPSLESLEKRLRLRGTDDDDTIARRLANARRELEAARSYDFHVINDELDRAERELASILLQKGCGAKKNDD